MKVGMSLRCALFVSRGSFECKKNGAAKEAASVK